MDARVLSIQSHVVRGYVGNKSATFPLQILGFEVDAINSVHFSNHTGYEHVKGQVLNEKDLGTVIDGLFSNGLNKYSHLLTGYVGSPSFLHKIGEVVKDLKAINKDLIYVCDPVMGDNGKMYVPESLLPIYRDFIIPLSDVITPNQYELELLTGKQITTMEDVWIAIDRFHKKGCKHVVVSSSELGDENNLRAFASSIKEGALMIAHVSLSSSGTGTIHTNPPSLAIVLRPWTIEHAHLNTKTEGGKKLKVIIDIPRLNANFTGTGDLFSALLLAWMHKTDDELIVSLENTVSSLQGVLKKTLAQALDMSNGLPPNAEQLELRLIQSKSEIENPERTIRCIVIT